MRDVLEYSSQLQDVFEKKCTVFMSGTLLIMCARNPCHFPSIAGGLSQEAAVKLKIGNFIVL